VTTGAGTSLETTQLSRGWATVYVFGGKPFQRVSRFRAAERRAHVAGRGAWKLWGGNFHARA
jgi:endonuclease YncB( thermonuclease family)